MADTVITVLTLWMVTLPLIIGSCFISLNRGIIRIGLSNVCKVHIAGQITQELHRVIDTEIVSMLLIFI